VLRFSTARPYAQTSVNFNSLVIKHKEYFMVYSYLFPYSYLEHLDSLRLGHAKRLISWVGLYAIEIMCKRNMTFSGNIFLIVSILTIIIYLFIYLFQIFSHSRCEFNVKFDKFKLGKISYMYMISLSKTKSTLVFVCLFVCLFTLQLKTAIRNASLNFTEKFCQFPF